MLPPVLTFLQLSFTFTFISPFGKAMHVPQRLLTIAEATHYTLLFCPQMTRTPHDYHLQVSDELLLLHILEKWVLEEEEEGTGSYLCVIQECCEAQQWWKE